MGLPFDEQIFLNDARYMQLSSFRKRNIIKDDIVVDNTIIILVKLVTCKSFCLDICSKFYYNHYLEQLANTYAFQKWCKNFYKKLFAFDCNFYPKLGLRVRSMHSRQTHRKQKNHSQNIPNPGMGSSTRISHANRVFAKTTARRRLLEYHQSKVRIFEIRICLSSF